MREIRPFPARRLGGIRRGDLIASWAWRGLLQARAEVPIDRIPTNSRRERGTFPRFAVARPRRIWPLDIFRRLRVLVGVERWDDFDGPLESGMAARPREIRLRHMRTFDVSRSIVARTGHGHLRPVVALVDAHLLDELAVGACV